MSLIGQFSIICRIQVNAVRNIHYFKYILFMSFEYIIPSLLSTIFYTLFQAPCLPSFSQNLPPISCIAMGSHAVKAGSTISHAVLALIIIKVFLMSYIP